MPNINIKQEKEEPMEAGGSSAPAANQGRKIVLKKKLLANKGKRKDKAKLDKIKVKTLDEIMREKKIKKEKAEGVSSTAEPTPSANTTTTVPRTHTNSSISVSKLNYRLSVPLKNLSIPLTALPKEQHSIQTFIGNPFLGIHIKKEPVDPEEEQQPATRTENTGTSSSGVEKPPSVTTNHQLKQNTEQERQLNSNEENLFIRIQNRIKSEPKDEDVNHNEVDHTEDRANNEISNNHPSDNLSEPSEGSSEPLSTSVDFSDIPLGSTQDDDTMSLFAFDNTFEEEMESESPRKHTSQSTRRRSQERDLRETIQNRSRQVASDKNNKRRQESDRRTVEDTNMKKKINEKRKNKEDKHDNNSEGRNRFCSNGGNSFKVPQADGNRNILGGQKGPKLRFKKKMDSMDRGKVNPNTPVLDHNFLNDLSPFPRDKVQRLEHPHQKILPGNQPPIQPVMPFPNNNGAVLQYWQGIKRFEQNSGGYRDRTLNTMKHSGTNKMLNNKNAYLQSRKPLVVAGGCGFFQDLKKQEEIWNSNNKYIEEGPSINHDSWHENDKRIKKLRILSGDGLMESIDNQANKGTSSTDVENPSRSRNHQNKGESSSHRLPSKRRSFDENGDDRELLTKEPKREKQVYCGTQLRLGECHFSYCRFVHLSPNELEEYKKNERIRPPLESYESPVKEHSSDNEASKFQEEKEKQQMCKGLAEAANQLLDSLKLGEALKVMFHLYQMEPTEKDPLIKLLERTLFLCGEDGVDSNVAAQVSSQVFDMIPKVRGNYNQHDFTTLIHCLCHTGQYIRGYEVLAEMKKSDITATHEVYLDLIQSSQAEPNWAFDLIEEVKSLGLFKSSICSALILLGAKAGKALIERTWLLFKFVVLEDSIINTYLLGPRETVCFEVPRLLMFPEAELRETSAVRGPQNILLTEVPDMMDNSIKPTKESFLAMLDLFADNGEGQKLLDALVLHNDPTITPSFKCNKVIIKHSKDNADMISINVASVCEIAKERDPMLDVETWNVLLRNCYSEKFHLVSEAQQVYSMMKKYNIPLTTEGYNGLVCTLSEANQTISAMEVFNTLSLASGHLKVKDYKLCITALIAALIRSKQIEELEKVVLFALDNGLMIEEKPLLLVITRMELEKKFQEIHQLFKKMQSTKEEIPLSLFRKLVATLEKWSENPAASLAVYAAMRRAYPIMPDASTHSKSGTSDTQSDTAVNVNQKKKVCRFFMTTGCAFGNACRFAHSAAEAASWQSAQSGNVEVVNSGSPEKKNPFVLRSASFPIAGQPPLPTQPPLLPHAPFPMSVAAPAPSPDVFAASGPFVLKGSNPLTGFHSTAIPTVPFHMGFPQASLFAPAIPNGGSTSIQSDTTLSNPGTIQPGADRLSLDLGPSAASISTTDTRASQSAPALSGSHTDEGFHFPVKTELNFYKAKIIKATEEKDLEELARLYVQMKKEQVPVSNEMLLLFYNCFIACKDIGESLSSFVAIIDIQLDNLDGDEDSSQKESLDFDDLKFVGELGVALMQLCRSQKRLDEGYLVLHVLHQYGVNYFQYPASFVPNSKVLSSTSIALLATDMCLCLEKDPQFDGAVEVLRGCNYAVASDGGLLSSEEAEKRRLTFEKLAAHYLSVGNYAVVYELLQHVGDKDVFGMTSLKSIYNELLKKYIAEEKVDDAVGVIREMENEFISRDPVVLRALVTCLGTVGRFVQASEIFKSSCLQGAYPAFPTGDGLWNATVWISFSKFEIQFYLEQHLQLLNKHVEQHRIASQLPYDEKHLKSLRIIITKEENSTSHITVDAAKQMQENIIEILCSDFNPPLSCGKSDKFGEVIVNPRSLRRWFLANPPPEFQTSPFSGSDGSTEHQRNVIASKGKPGITIRVDNRYHNDPKTTALYDEYEPRIRHTVCGHLTRYLRQGKVANKEEFKKFARELTKDFLQNSNLEDLNKDYKQVRARIVTFVDCFFEKRTNPNSFLFRNQEL